MTIVYSCVSRGNVVLAEYYEVRGNYATIATMLLGKIDARTSARASYSYDQYFFNYIADQGLIFMCMCDSTTKTSLSFRYLEDLRNRFMTAYSGRWADAPAHKFNDEFSRTLAQQMKYFSTNPAADKVGAIKEQIDQTKEVLIQNIDKLLERGERIELLVEKTALLEGEATTFKKTAVQLKRHMWWKNLKLWLIIIGVVAVVIFLIVWFSCGFPDFKNCRGQPSPADPGAAPVAAAVPAGGSSLI